MLDSIQFGFVYEMDPFWQMINSGKEMGKI